MNVNVSRSLHPLRVRYAAPALARLRAFWNWWSGELFELLPADRHAVDLDIDADRFRRGLDQQRRVDRTIECGVGSI